MYNMKTTAMERPDYKDKRQFPRKSHSKPVQFQYSDPFISGGGVAKDISEGGMRIRLNGFVPLNTELPLTFTLDHDNVIECPGTVVWIEKSRHGESYTAGLKFPDNETVEINRQKIHRFLSRL